MSLKANDLFDVNGKVVIVTGGGRGIGKMIAQGYIQNGATVYIISRKLEKCEATAAELNALGPGKCIAMAADLSKVSGCDSILKELTEKYQVAHVDILVNNSGASWGEPLEKFPEKGWDRVMDLNVKGLFFLIQRLLPLIKASTKKGASPARIINIGSIAGIHHQIVPTFSYDCSKAAVHQLTKHLSMALSPHNITVNAIAPGFFPTDMSKGLETYTTRNSIVRGIPLQRVGQAPDIVGICLFLSGEAGSWVTGIILPVDGGVLIKPAL